MELHKATDRPLPSLPHPDSLVDYNNPPQKQLRVVWLSTTMADPLSTAASALACIGAVDVLVRTGRELFRYIAEIKDAPKDAQRLRASIKDVQSFAHDTKLFLEEETKVRTAGGTSAPAAAASPPPSAVNQVEATLKAVNTELGDLVHLATKHNGVTNPGGRIKWVFERKIGYALQRIEKSKLSLVAALALLGTYVWPRESRLISD